MLYANYMRNKMKHLEQIVKVPATGTQAPPLTLKNSKGKPLKDYLYAQGRTRSGSKVTWTKNSRHTSRRVWSIYKMKRL